MIPPPNRAVIRKIKAAIQDIEDSIYPTLKDVFTKHSDIIKEINTEQQLYAVGQDSKGKSLGSYAESTKRIKIRKRQPIDRVTLKDTGDFYESVRIIAKDDELIIETSIEYAKYLTKKYGADILGIQDMELSDFTKKYIFPELENNINEIIKAKML